MTTVQIDFNNNVELKFIKPVFVCKICGHEWMITLLSTGQIPQGADVCGRCFPNPKNTKREWSESKWKPQQ